jgi:SNF2 family DNA or RNA helicase
MLLLQCGFAEHRCVIWGERTPTTRTGSRSKAKTPAAHPFAAASEELEAALAAAAPTASTAKTDSFTIWLPTVAGAPVPSSPLLGDAPEGKPELKPWQVPVAVPQVGPALDFLASSGDQPTLTPGVGVGVTLRYASAVLRFAAALVARERFLPDVVQDGNQWFARWSPIISGPDSGRFNQFAKAMPPAWRAIGEKRPTRPAAEVLREFIGFAVDPLVRGTAFEKPRKQFDSVHDRWLHALHTETGAMGHTGEELLQLAAQLRDWRSPLATADAAPFRLCLRLDEPAEKDRTQTWQLQYLLQAHDDPSLQIPAADVWRGKVRITQTDLKPILLAGLGQAANLSSEIDTSLKTAAPAGFTTTTTGAHRFLTETAWLLEQAGFGVLLPAWWTGHATKQKLEVVAKVKSPPMSGSGGLSLEDLVTFQWAAALGGDEITLDELQQLAKLKAPLVRFRGKWVQVSAEDIRAAIELLERRPEKIAARDAMKMALGLTPEGTPLPVRRATATGWVEAFLNELTDATFAEIAPPTDLKANLRPYQVRGYSWLAFLRRWGLGACLADDMGLGKTVQALALLLHDRADGEKRPVLLVCPMSVVGNWARESARFAPDLPILIHHGPNRAKTKTALKKAASSAALVLTSYGLLARDRELFEPVRWAGVILDEAQTIKNPNTKTAQAARAITGEYRVALTGTPVENHVGDLWALGQFLNPGLLGTAAAFRREFFIPIQHHQNVEAMNRLKKLAGPFLLRRLKTDPTVIRDLPAKIETTEYCTLTREQASLYTAVVNELDRAITGVEGIKRKGLVLGALSKLKQVCNHPAQFLGDNSAIPNRSGKLTRLTQMLEELLETGDRALVFTQFTEMGEIIRRHLQDTFAREVLFLHGGTPRKQRDQMVQRFQAPDGPPIFLLSLKAGGTGLNLTAATHVFHFDRWWNPAVETQATDRAFRIGQTRTVQVHPFVCVGTLEEKIDEMLTRKRDVAAKVVGTGEAWLTELDNEQLREAFALRPDAVED